LQARDIRLGALQSTAQLRLAGLVFLGLAMLISTPLGFAVVPLAQ
jgi:hypothetical protein